MGVEVRGERNEHRRVAWTVSPHEAVRSELVRVPGAVREHLTNHGFQALHLGLHLVVIIGTGLPVSGAWLSHGGRRANFSVLVPARRDRHHSRDGKRCRRDRLRRRRRNRKPWGRCHAFSYRRFSIGISGHARSRTARTQQPRDHQTRNSPNPLIPAPTHPLRMRRSRPPCHLPIRRSELLARCTVEPRRLHPEWRNPRSKGGR
jgi:hypothetical protein